MYRVFPLPSRGSERSDYPGILIMQDGFECLKRQSNLDKYGDGPEMRFLVACGAVAKVLGEGIPEEQVSRTVSDLDHIYLLLLC